MKKRLSIVICFLAMTIGAMAQNSRAAIRDAIRGWGECRNVAITKSNGDVALYGLNGYSCQSVPNALLNAVRELNQEQKFIDDVCLTDNGSWIVIFGNDRSGGNGWRSEGVPSSLLDRLQEWNANREVITSVSFNDAGQWVAVSREHISASDTWIQNWLVEGGKDYGMLYGVCLTDDAMVATYENGFKFYGEVPESLRQALREATYNVYRVKVSGNSWFFSDGESRYRYNM